MENAILVSQLQLNVLAPVPPPVDNSAGTSGLKVIMRVQGRISMVDRFRVFLRVNGEGRWEISILLNYVRVAVVVVDDR